MIVAVHFCNKDAALAVNNLESAIRFDGKSDLDGLLCYDEVTKPEYVGAVMDVARPFFRSVTEYRYDPPFETSWPRPQNHSFQRVAWHIWANIKQPFFWWEADAVPLRPRWLADLVAEYAKGGKPFMGHIVDGMGHMNGCAFYPPNIVEYSQDAMRVRNVAWDVVLGMSLNGHVHNANHLIQHCWHLDADRKPTNGEGKPPTFASWEEVASVVDFNCALFHRCKDGSLMREIVRHNSTTEVNVPRHVEVAEPAAPAAKLRKQKTKAIVEMLIVTYKRDQEWLKYCLKALQKHFTGLAGVVVAVPDQSMDEMITRYGARAYFFDEEPGKGFLHHQYIMASADVIVGEHTEYVMHLDADCIYHSPANLDDYFTKGKPDYVIRTYDSLFSHDRKVVSDCHQWKEPTEKQLGFPVEMYTMCRHPSTFPRAFYKKYRQHLELVHGRTAKEYLLAGKNSFPQDRMDFTAMGAFAYKTMPERFNWIDISELDHTWKADRAIRERPIDLHKCFWSHGGITPEIKKDIEGFLK